MTTNVKFINYLMKILDLNVKEMKHFLDVQSKTIYNYRQMSFKNLPEKIKKRFYVLFRLNNIEDIYEYLSKTDEIGIVELRERLLVSATLRYKLMETGYNESLKREYLNNNRINNKSNIISEKKNLRITDYEQNSKVNESINIAIQSKNISKLFVQVLETELNKKIKCDNYDFIAYIKQYSNND